MDDRKDPLSQFSQLVCNKIEMTVRWYDLVDNRVYIKFKSEPSLLLDDGCLVIELGQGFNFHSYAKRLEQEMMDKLKKKFGAEKVRNLWTEIMQNLIKEKVQKDKQDKVKQGKDKEDEEGKDDEKDNEKEKKKVSDKEENEEEEDQDILMESMELAAKSNANAFDFGADSLGTKENAEWNVKIVRDFILDEYEVHQFN